MSLGRGYGRREYDAVIVGGGHNGLVAAAYLARAGLSVCVLERRYIVGGACVTEELAPMFKVSTAAYVNSLFRPEIIRDLHLREYGLELLERNPSSFTPFPDGRYLFLGPEAEMNLMEISKFSSRDAAHFTEYEAYLNRIARFVEPLLMRAPPDPLSRNPRDLLALARMAREFRKLGRDAYGLIEMLSMSAWELLGRWFESEELKVTLATDGIIGTMAGPRSPGTAYVLFHHVMGETNGVRGVWAYVKGGMGGLTTALAQSARSFGATIECNAPVAEILVRNGKAYGVRLEGGEEITSRVVLSNADPNVTFLKLVKETELPSDFAKAVKQIDYSSGSAKINVLVNELPNFKALPGGVGPQHRGTIHISPSLEYMERAWSDSEGGLPSSSPILEITIPSAVDPTIAPRGKHVIGMFVQYAPYRPRNGRWDDASKNAFADRCLEILAEYAPNVRGSIIQRQVLTPVDIEREFALTGGNIFQGAMHLNQLLFMRPLSGWAKYCTPIRGLYICGASTHPGGGVMGACGHNAAMEVLRHLRKRIFS
jgi:phytoene dehydrogenase-like protein